MSTNRSESGVVAIVGVGAILPDAPDATTFWQNLREGRYSISDVTDRWDPDLYYDPDPAAPDMTYTKIGGWCRDYDWNPLGWRMPIPPKVSEVMDPAQKWAVAGAREALLDFGYPDRPLDKTRTAVIVGNALGGDFHLRSASRILFPEINEELKNAPSFKSLPADVRGAVLEELVAGVRTRIPDITEDTMPGELGNIVSGRVAALFDLKGPNYITDAACASALAAISAAVEGLRQHDFDAVITGGIDANMSASTFVKFCKIGALSATGSRPYAEGADGFVMGEGAAVFLMKRLEDAERDGDKIYAVLLGMGGSSDGKGKGITAPNPVGQRLAVERGWKKAGVAPSAGDMVEGHGTSTKVGDVVEVEAMTDVFKGFGLPVGSVALGSVKSNIGHLKGAAGAAGVLKAALSLYHKELPPSVGFHAPNPNIDFSTSPFAVNTELRAWEKAASNGGGIRRAGVSAFGFGGTNFHLVMEEYVPGRHRVRNAQVQGAELAPLTSGSRGADAMPAKAPLRGALVIGGATEAEIADKLREVKAQADRGDAPLPRAPRESDLRASVRLAIDYGDAEELAGLAEKALQALEEGDDGRWRALRNKGVYLGRGAPGKVAFLFPGQGSQYVDMLKGLRDAEPVVAETFREADKAMTPLLDGPLTGKIFVESDDDAARAEAEEALKQTAITQPAVLTVDTALCRLYAAYGIEPDLVMGHSLGEYAALVAAGGIPLGDALTAVAARGDAMTRLSLEDNGLMAAVFGPVDRVQEILDAVDGYVVVANLNSSKECVIGGATVAMGKAMEALKAEKLRVAQLSVSHAFHTHIVEPASEPLVDVLRELGIQAPHTPVVANVDASFYPTGPGAKERMLDILGKQIGSPVQFVKGLEKLYDAGARVFVEMGPKRALYALAEDVLGDRDGVTVLYTNHPRTGDVVSANRALCGMYAEGLGRGLADELVAAPVREVAVAAPFAGADSTPAAIPGEDRYLTLGRMFADFLDKSFETYSGGSAREKEPVRIGFTGAALGLPGEKVFAEDNLERILRGEQFIQSTPEESRQGVLDRRITRIVKGPNGEARFETISDPADVIKLAGMGGELDLVEEYGFPEDRLAALDRVTRLAIAAGIDALRDAGIPLVMRYKSTTTGSKLPVGWGLPEDMRDDTGIVFGSAFPGYDYLIRIVEEYHEDRSKRESLAELEQVRSKVTDAAAQAELDGRIADLKDRIDEKPYQFDRRFLFQVLSMGHSQFAEYIGARGPNTQVNGACATGMQAVTVARDWIETGRCRRVVVITADDVTTDAMLPWYSAGFLASGAAATDERIEDAALPFDRRRHGLLFGMGSASLVLEDLSVAAERGVVPICELLGSVIANSAFHGSRLDLSHILHVMENLVSQVERRWGVSRYDMAKDMVFVSHETYTPARGGSAGAEVTALRHVFGDHTDSIVVANTKGFTGHPMAVAIEEVLAVKMLETGVIPPVANFKEVDPELGPLNLSQGGSHPVQYALRLGAGFGSQISMSILRWTPPPDGARRNPADVGFHHRVADQAVWSAWLSRVTGYAQPELEVVQRTLRVKDQGVPAVEPAARQATRMGVSPIPAAAVRPAGIPVPGAPLAPVGESPAPEAVAEAPMDAVATRVLEIVSEQTGYPIDMLELDLDLEADLGIDTVKQAEMFAAIRAEYDIERDDEVALRDYPTLGRAIEFVYEKRPDLEDTVVDSPSGAAVAAPQATPDVSAETSEGDPVAAKVLEIISQQTGYPPDMLEMDLDLEADLGIDTVKQAEMFAAIRAEYDIERDENVALRDYPTLADAIAFVYEMRPDLRESSGAGSDAGPESGDEEQVTAEAEPQGELELTATAMAAVPVASGSMEAAQAVPRRVPVPRLRPPLDRFPGTGIEIGEGARVIVVPDEGGVARALVRRLTKKGAEVLLVDPSLATDDLVREMEEWRAGGPVTGMYWLPAMDPVLPAELADPDDRREAIRRRVKSLHGSMRGLYDVLGEAGTFFVSGVRLGGYHGYDEDGAADVVGGAVAGYTKAFARERPDALVKTVDFEPSGKTAALARVLLNETLRDPGVVEVGYAAGQRWCVGLEEQAVEPGELPGGEAVYLVTGAAGSIVSAIVKDLAEAAGGTFWLLDLAPEPDENNPDLDRVATDPDGLKRDIFERLRGRGDHVTPVQVEREMAGLEREAAAVAAIKAIRAAGGEAHYRTLDLRDPEAVGAATAEIIEAHGRVDVLIHAAGMEISRSIPKKSQEEFDLVFDVKAEGWYNIMAGLGDAPLGAAVVFSSIAGRFGNAGQVDYSAANDLLCKAVSEFRRTRPDTRGISIDWTAWRDIGMAARGSIPSIMKAAGIDMLSPEAGIPVVRRELGAGTRGEVVIAQALGVMLHEDAERTALDADFVAKTTVDAGPMAGAVRGFTIHDGLVVDTELRPADQPFLEDHRIAGIPVLPGVMGLEAMAEAARIPFPGRHVTAIEDVSFNAPFKFYRDEARTVTVHVTYGQDGDDIVADCRLMGSRQLVGHDDPEVTLHFTGRVRLAGAIPENGDLREMPEVASEVVGAPVIYGTYFHGPAYQVLKDAWRVEGLVVGRFAEDLPPNHAPPEQPTLASPRLVELAFQTAGLAELAESERMGLPSALDRLDLLQPGVVVEAGASALVTTTADGVFDVDVADAQGNMIMAIKGYRTSALPQPVKVDGFEALKG